MDPQTADATDEEAEGAETENVVTSQPGSTTTPEKSVPVMAMPPPEKSNPVFAMPPPPNYSVTVDIGADDKTEKTSLTSETKGDYGGTENLTLSSPTKGAAPSSPSKTETTPITTATTIEMPLSATDLQSAAE